MKNYTNSELKIEFPELKLILSSKPIVMDIVTREIMNGLTKNFTLEHYRHFKKFGSPLRK